LKASFEFFFEEPNRILSGRLESWRTLGNLLVDHPLYLLLGVGYKTLPYTDLAGAPIVADNMYLSLLVETGLPGLLAFLWMNLQILIAGYRAAMRSSLFGTCIFCFWTGEMVQMLSGDLFTYWRVLPLYFWVLAAASREMPRTDARPVR
jgi:O-antigen ligase